MIFKTNLSKAVQHFLFLESLSFSCAEAGSLTHCEHHNLEEITLKASAQESVILILLLVNHLPLMLMSEALFDN